MCVCVHTFFCRDIKIFPKTRFSSISDHISSFRDVSPLLSYFISIKVGQIKLYYYDTSIYILL